MPNCVIIKDIKEYAYFIQQIKTFFSKWLSNIKEQLVDVSAFIWCIVMLSNSVLNISVQDLFLLINNDSNINVKETLLVAERCRFSDFILFWMFWCFHNPIIQTSNTSIINIGNLFYLSFIGTIFCTSYFDKFTPMEPFFNGMVKYLHTQTHPALNM